MGCTGVPSVSDRECRVRDGAEPCTPRELFCALLVEPEEHAHFFAPARRFANAAFAGAFTPPLDSDPERFVDGLLRFARDTLEPIPLNDFAPSWPARVVREYGPAGVSDGAWLRGALGSGFARHDPGSPLLESFRIRAGAGGRRESHAERYQALLRSLGYPPAALTRWDRNESPPCTDIAYEHGLLGVCLGLMPASFELEALGFNLWMAGVGPAPLLQRLTDLLAAQGACLRFLQRSERGTLLELARRAVVQRLRESDAEGVPPRVARGFGAAHASYLRWERAMLGPNVPFTAWDSVLEMVQRKARFAADHHRDVSFGEDNVRQLLLAGRSGHERLLDVIASSDLVCPGDPDRSPFLCQSLSIDGPMFDAFTAVEKIDLRAWIASVGTRAEIRTRTPAVALVGDYGPADDAGGLRASARERYGGLELPQLRERLLCEREEPALDCFSRDYAEAGLARLDEWMAADPRLGGAGQPEYSAAALAQMLAGSPLPPLERVDVDGIWLWALGDTRRLGADEYAWLLRTVLARRRLERARDPSPARAPHLERLKLHLDVLNAAIVRTPQRFMAEALGLNLAIESGPAGAEQPIALSGPALFDLFAQPDADAGPRERGQWSLWAVQAFMARVREGSPEHVAAQWRRLWRFWRLQKAVWAGGAPERQALVEWSLSPASLREGAGGRANGRRAGPLPRAEN
jgi:hypothetical protein